MKISGLFKLQRMENIVPESGQTIRVLHVGTRNEGRRKQRCGFGGTFVNFEDSSQAKTIVAPPHWGSKTIDWNESKGDILLKLDYSQQMPFSM